MSLAHSRPKKLYNCLFKSGWKLHHIVLKKTPRWPSLKIRWSSVIFAWKLCFIKKNHDLGITKRRPGTIWLGSNIILFTFHRTHQKLMKTIIQRKHLWIFKGGLFLQRVICYSNLQKKIFQITIQHLKFDITAHNSKQLIQISSSG